MKRLITVFTILKLLPLLIPLIVLICAVLLFLLLRKQNNRKKFLDINFYTAYTTKNKNKRKNSNPAKAGEFPYSACRHLLRKWG